MAAVVTDPQQRAVLARQIVSNPLYVEIMASLKQKQVEKFLAGAPPDEVMKAQAIAMALKMLEDALASVLTTERMLLQRQGKAQHRHAD